MSSRSCSGICHRHWRGWRCLRSCEHTGPCALVPRWWNLKWRWQARGLR